MCKKLKRVCEYHLPLSFHRLQKRLKCGLTNSDFHGFTHSGRISLRLQNSDVPWGYQAREKIAFKWIGCFILFGKLREVDLQQGTSLKTNVINSRGWRKWHNGTYTFVGGPSLELYPGEWYDCLSTMHLVLWHWLETFSLQHPVTKTVLFNIWTDFILFLISLVGNSNLKFVVAL